MWKKIFLSVGLIIILVIGIELFNNTKKQNQHQTNQTQNQTEISSKYVTDDCTNEWQDYATTIEKEIQVTNQPLNDENTHYIVKEDNNLVTIYYINQNQEEILYKVTDISLEYLGEQDVQSLKQGIDVYGLQNLNQLIEDFE